MGVGEKESGSLLLLNNPRALLHLDPVFIHIELRVMSFHRI